MLVRILRVRILLLMGVILLARWSVGVMPTSCQDIQEKFWIWLGELYLLVVYLSNKVDSVKIGLFKIKIVKIKPARCH